MFIDREDRAHQMTPSPKSRPSDEVTTTDEIQRVANGTIDSEYYLKHASEVRSKSVLGLFRRLLGRK